MMTGQRLRPARPPDWRAMLSRRELDVARCIANGLTNRDSAAQLGITQKTVEKHLTRIYLKLGVRSRAQLAIYIISVK